MRTHLSPHSFHAGLNRPTPDVEPRIPIPGLQDRTQSSGDQFGLESIAPDHCTLKKPVRHSESIGPQRDSRTMPSPGSRKKENPGCRIQADCRGSSPALVNWGGDEGRGMSSIRNYVIALASSPESAATFRFEAAKKIRSCAALVPVREEPGHLCVPVPRPGTLSSCWILSVRVIRSSNRVPRLRCCMPRYRSKCRTNRAQMSGPPQVPDLTQHVMDLLFNKSQPQR